MGAQDLILGSRVLHLRELKAEVAALKADNARLRDENASLQEHLDLALLAAEDLRTLAPGGRLIIIDGWNLILGAKKEARNPDDLITQTKSYLAENSSDRAWIVFDGPKENSRTEDRLRISYTGGTGPHRADRFICDFVRMARFRGDLSKIDVRTNDKDFKKTILKMMGR